MDHLRLIKRAQSDDKEAFVLLMKYYEKDLYKVAKGFFRSDEDVSDAMQETILACYTCIGQLREPRYFKTWLIRILINNCNSLIRANRKYADEAAPEAAREDGALENVEFMALMDTLDEKYRQILILHYAEGLKIGEISELTGLSADAVKGRLKTGRKKAKAEYEKTFKEMTL